MSVISIVKARLTEPLPSDELLEIYLEEVGQTIKNYCNREDIPNELKFVHANMAIDLITGERRNEDPAGNTAVSSIKEGDATVQFGSARIESRERATQNLLYDYAKQLNRYRKLKR